jgi:hypothetical protein
MSDALDFNHVAAMNDDVLDLLKQYCKLHGPHDHSGSQFANVSHRPVSLRPLTTEQISRSESMKPKYLPRKQADARASGNLGQHCASHSEKINAELHHR